MPRKQRNAIHTKVVLQLRYAAVKERTGKRLRTGEPYTDFVVYYWSLTKAKWLIDGNPNIQWDSLQKAKDQAEHLNDDRKLNIEAALTRPDLRD